MGFLSLDCRLEFKVMEQMLYFFSRYQQTRRLWCPNRCRSMNNWSREHLVLILLWPAAWLTILFSYVWFSSRKYRDHRRKSHHSIEIGAHLQLCAVRRRAASWCNSSSCLLYHASTWQSCLSYQISIYCLSCSGSFYMTQ